MSSVSDRRPLAAAAVALLVLIGGCDRSVQPTETLPPLQAASLDADAGAWRMFVLAAPEQVAVAAPAATTSDAYRAELAAVKAAQAAMTRAQRANVEYWSGGGVLRWNQVMRELVARYNLPPAPRPDGSYPVPDAENPFADPNFPFASPPYAARAYSYVSVAQYEALKATWHWKFRYNRAAPAKVDAGVQALAPVGDLPAYPSEDAVLAGATAEMLKLLFPGSVEEITRRAAEEREAALLSGRATASDVAAGLALGRSVAALVIARARADGMGAAGGTAALWQGMATAATARGEVAWLSQETPARPPMLPNFGAVQAWTMTAAQLATLDPPAPPSTSSARMAEDLAEVKRVTSNLTREQLAVALKWNDGAGTYTPPGHWNDIAAEYVRDARMSEVRAARVFAALNMAMHDAAVACWAIKFRHYNPRPVQLDPTIKTSIGLPNFPAYPSGHSTFSAAASTVLGAYFPSAAGEFAAQAEEAGISRLYGGIHYRADIENGKAHGLRIGAAVVQAVR
ncbi:phosphatase PAP2 family protein [Roseisolibacter sp. H3M3-2]|uniref:phosphatase PAP2 family protein n=1 Tax=Roseisolibacter sp. H3M3-2 TaxID=3031323 RepID=UPI0023DC67CD|nr:phosphatase PAP2 family protein [Roseisolibacter sp. H3M3-2]MDF1503644.1 phosphatase PAP2 family protein [Roseisolibacter sp. H3M3-2]